MKFKYIKCFFFLIYTRGSKNLKIPTLKGCLNFSALNFQCLESPIVFPQFRIHLGRFFSQLYLQLCQSVFYLFGVAISPAISAMIILVVIVFILKFKKFCSKLFPVFILLCSTSYTLIR